MANQEHLDLLKQGVTIWNQWRREHRDIQPNLSGADLGGFNLNGADLSDANFKGANFKGVNLHGADLSGASLKRANLSNANLDWADLSSADLRWANFNGASFSGADLRWADLSMADLSNATMQWTNLGNMDLRLVRGMGTVNHRGPSTIGIDTIYRSQGHIPVVFLQGAGVPDTFIEYICSLAHLPIQYYTCFISYSGKDEDFAKQLYADLQNNGVRCWFAPEDLKIGDKIRTRIDESIRLYDKLLLVLSQHSVFSQWVEQEVETALEKERKESRTVLFPIRLDNTVMDIDGGWPALIRNTRYIGDFTHWKRLDDYQKALERLLRNLKAEVKPEA